MNEHVEVLRRLRGDLIRLDENERRTIDAAIAARDAQEAAMTEVKPVGWAVRRADGSLDLGDDVDFREPTFAEHEALGRDMPGAQFVPLYDERAVEALRAENERKTRMLADCFRAAGADPDGRSDTQLAEDAVAAVTMLRCVEEAAYA